MLKYTITIMDEQGLVQLFTKDESNIEQLIKKELGGYSNLYYTSTVGAKEKSDDCFQAGTTKDGSLAFSILCRKI